VECVALPTRRADHELCHSGRHGHCDAMVGLDVAKWSCRLARPARLDPLPGADDPPLPIVRSVAPARTGEMNGAEACAPPTTLPLPLPGTLRRPLPLNIRLISSNVLRGLSPNAYS